MALKIGNNYLVWVAAPGGSPVFAKLAGQQSGKLGGSLQTADASHKTSGGVSLKVPGLRDAPIDLSFVVDLPDTGGYSVVETAFKASTTVLVAIRKGGAAATVTDNVFLCEMYVTTLDVDFALNAAVSGSIKFEPAVAPTLDLTLA